MKILITGAKGMLAQAIRERFKTDPEGKPNKLTLTDREADAEIGSYALDITDYKAVEESVSNVKPDLIINCAAYTNVDGAERAEELAEQVNAKGPENLAKAAAENDAILVHISTDYVFGGNKPVQVDAKELETEPEKYVYFEDDEKNPESAYGRTKLKGEEAIAKNCSKYYIFRTAWLYGKGGKNFVDTMIEVGKAQEAATEAGEEQRAEVRVVDDQHGSPTYTKDLADIIYQAIYKQIPFGIYNATNEGFTTWADFTKKIYELSGVSCKVIGISSAEYEAETEKKAAEKGEKRIVAKRPLNSQMSRRKLLDAKIIIGNWEDALKHYLEETGNLKTKE